MLRAKTLPWTLVLGSIAGCTQPNPLYYATGTSSDGQTSSESGLGEADTTAGPSQTGEGSATTTGDAPGSTSAPGDSTGDPPESTTGETGASESTGNTPSCDGSGSALCHDSVYMLVSTTAFVLDVADYDQDGDVDIVLASEADDEVLLLEGSGNGLFSDGAPLELPGTRPMGICFANLDGTPPLEVVTADRDGHSLTVVTTEGGVLAIQQVVDTNVRTEDCAIVDVDGDGALDVTAALRDAHLVAVAYNEGDGTLGSPTEFGVADQPETLAAAPTDEVAVGASHRGGKTASVLHEDGGGGLSPRVMDSDLEHYGSRLADLDGDGALDLVSSLHTVGEVIVYWDALAEGGPTGTTTEQVGTEPAHVAVGDFNADGELDIAVAVAGSDRLTVLSGLGGRNFAVTAFSLDGSPHDIAAADLNGDTIDDLALTLPSEGEVVLFLSNAN